MRQTLVALGGYLVSKHITDPANATAVANGLAPALLLLASFLWSHFHLGQAAENGPAPSSSAKSGAAAGVSLLLGSLMLTGLCAGVSLVGGCGTTPQKAAYVTAGTTITGVDAAMTAWADYVAQFHPPASQEAAVKAAYGKYQAAMLVMVDASQLYVTLAGSGSTNSPPAMDKANQASQAAAQAFADLLTLLRSFNIKI